MINFKNYITEQDEPQGKPLKHLTHLEDNVLHGGHEGVATAGQHLEDVHNKLLGKNNSTSVTTKYDGSPSIVFGQHPQTGQFFVASKSAFNKNPKINYTPEDIQRNHGHAPGLAEKLTSALAHLPKIMPRNGGVYQGDLMHTKSDIQKNKGLYSFTPNTITYSVPQNSAHGKALKNSELGVVVHTQYGGGSDLGSMSAMPLNPKQRGKFESHPDVHNIDPTIDVNPSNYTPEEQKEYLSHMENAKRSYAKMKPEAMDALQGHGEGLERHVNDMVRQGGVPSVQGYMDRLTADHQKDVDRVKTPAAKDRKIQAHAAVLKHISDNQDHFGKALELHSHLQAAKNVLTGVMAKNNPFTHTINGEATGPEGAVAVDKNGNASKFVDRSEFSRQNLLAGKYRKAQPIQEDVEQPVTHTIWYGRGQGLHGGHVAGAEAAMNDAAQQGGGHSIIFTHTHDKNNPLNPEQKLYYAKRGLPKGANVQMTSPEAPSLIQQAANLNKQGVSRLRIMAGSDRVKSYQDLFNRYNGVYNDKGEGFNFKHGIEVIPVGGERKEGDDSMASYSGTALRKAAVSDDKDTFDKMASPHLSPEDKDNMRADLKAGLAKFAKKPKPVKEGYVPNEGNAATAADLSARGAPQESGPLKKKKLKEEEETAAEYWSKNPRPETPVDRFMKNYAPVISQAKTAVDVADNIKKKNYKDAALDVLSQVPKVGLAAGAAKAIMRENTTGSVGGLGFNTGNPAAGETNIQQYIDTNGSLSKDDENGNLIKVHNNMHASLGFKEFDPKKDLAKGKK